MEGHPAPLAACLRKVITAPHSKTAAQGRGRQRHARSVEPAVAHGAVAVEAVGGGAQFDLLVPRGPELVVMT